MSSKLLRDKDIPFVEHRYKFFLLSALILLIGLILLPILGLNLGVDFQSGTTLEIYVDGQPLSSGEVESTLDSLGLEAGAIQLLGNNQEIAEVRFSGTLEQTEINRIREEFESRYGTVDLTESTVSPLVARELANQAFFGILLSAVAIVIYVAIRFEYRFGVAAVIALLHDALMMVVVFCLLRIEIDLTFIAAVLTVVGYSINDTIIIFDRMRENLRILKTKSVSDLRVLVNKSIVETLPRTLNTSITVFFAIVALWLLGGEGIRNFSFALFVGLLAGTYSSIFIAAPLWFEWKKREMNKKQMQPQNT